MDMMALQPSPEATK